MKNYSFLLLFISLSLTINVFAQNKKKEPKIDIKVNKEYDDKGNVIKYDSSYSYIYSDTNIVNFSDSLFNYPFNISDSDFFSLKHNFSDIDSIFSDPFFKDFHNFSGVHPFFDFNYFQNKIDSLEKEFYEKPEIIVPKQKQKEDKKIKSITL